jgi:UDP-glucuronate 4-epimerase
VLHPAASMKVLVTGAAGFIGSHVVERLLARGDDVIGLDNLCETYASAIKRQNAAPLVAQGRFVEADILDGDRIAAVLGEHRFDVVLHLAALPGVRPSIQRPWDYQRVNVEGTARLAHLMVEHDVRRLVFASSSSVYGRNTERPYRETDRVDAPASPYAASKRAGELLLSSLHHVHGLGVTCLRYFTVYGPRQRPEMAIHKFCRAVEAGQPITMFGTGDTSRDYTYIDDIVEGSMAAIDHADDAFRIYNLGDNQPVLLRDLIAKIGVALGKEPNVEQHPEQAGDVKHTLASIDAAGADLGYAPKVSIDEGLEKFVAWLRS